MHHTFKLPSSVNSTKEKHIIELGSSNIQQSTTFTPKNELLQDQNFNYRISKAFILKLTNIAASCLPMDIGSTNGQKQEIKTLPNNFFFFFSKDQKRKLIKEWQIFDNEIKKGGIKKLIIKMFRSNHIWGWL